MFVSFVTDVIDISTCNELLINLDHLQLLLIILYLPLAFMIILNHP